MTETKTEIEQKNPRSALRLVHHVQHLKKHGSLIHAAQVHGTHQLGPHAPIRKKFINGKFNELSDAEKQGNIVTHLKDDKGNDIIVTDCKEYLGDHVHCKPILDMTALRLIQQKYGMSEKLFKETINKEKKAWKNAWEVGLSTEFMQLRMVEVAHNYQLHLKRPELKAIGNAGKEEQSWRYKHTLRHVNFMSHNKGKYTEDNNMERELDIKKREILAAYVFQALKNVYLMMGVQKHDTTISQIVFKYVRRHDLLDALVSRLEKRYKKYENVITKFMYPVQAGKRALMRGELWPGTNGKVKQGQNSTDIKQEELDAMNWMFKKLQDHRRETARLKDIEKTKKTCIFSHTNEGSPCFPSHPCAKIKHEKRTRAIIVKCFWNIVRPYCENNQRHVGAMVPIGMLGQKRKKKKKEEEEEEKKTNTKTKTTISMIEGVPVVESKKNRRTTEESLTKEKNNASNEMEKEEKEMEETMDELEGEEEEEKEKTTKDGSADNEDNKDDNTAHDPYDAEDAEEYDAACDHVLRSTFTETIAWYESKGLRPELEENAQASLDLAEKRNKDGEERRKHKFLPNQEEGEGEEEKEKETKSLAAKEEEDALIAALPPADSSVHALLSKKSTLLKSVGGLKSKLKRWYVKHGYDDKAKDEVHLTEISTKYLKHQDLLFTRLHVKYHVTND